MTTIDINPSTFANFRIGAGRPSTARTLSRTEHLDFETALVETLRAYTNGLARDCQSDTPPEYAAFVNDLIEVDPDEAPTAWSARLACLLHIYADYMPSTECQYLDFSPSEYHGWQSPDGLVVIDVVTTLMLTELNPDGDLARVEMNARNAMALWGSLFAGVRYIVLDAPYESTWYPATGLPVPLHMSDINPVLTDSDFGGVSCE
jgi:hypothetical protein